MSFILDALKKAEAERQRQTGPTLLEVRVTAPRRRFPLWILLIGGLLGINVILLGVFLLRRPPPESAPATPALAAPAAAAPGAGQPAASPPAAAVGPVLSASPPYAASPYAAPPYGQPTYPPQPYAQQPAQSPYGAGGYGAAPAQSPYPAQAYAPPVYGTPAVTPQPARVDPGTDNPADYEPAVTSVGSSARARGAEPHAEPPSLSELDGNMPDLRLDMHVYSTRPADRYALINMHHVREGDTLPEGPRVIAIDRDGVELNYRGTDFMLHPQ